MATYYPGVDSPTSLLAGGLGSVRSGSRREPSLTVDRYHDIMGWFCGPNPSLEHSQGPWVLAVISLLGEELGVTMARVWPLPTLPAPALFSPSSGKLRALTRPEGRPLPHRSAGSFTPSPLRGVLAPPLTPNLHATYPALKAAPEVRRAWGGGISDALK